AAGAAARAREHAPSLGALAAERERLNAAAQKRREDAPQTLLIERADDPSARRDGDGLRLLGDDHDDRVGLRADGERGAVAHAIAMRARSGFSSSGTRHAAARICPPRTI